MGMLINGRWDHDADRSMICGAYIRENSALSTAIDEKVTYKLRAETNRFFWSRQRRSQKRWSRSRYAHVRNRDQYEPCAPAASVDGPWDD